MECSTILNDLRNYFGIQRGSVDTRFTPGFVWIFTFVFCTYAYVYSFDNPTVNDVIYTLNYKSKLTWSFTSLLFFSMKENFII